jgi:carboxypeptidase family protein
MRVWIRSLAAALAVLAISLPASAQVLGSIAGTVRDTSGAVLPGATVEASSDALIEKTRGVLADGAGQYRIVNLPPGVYTVGFTLAGFSTVKRDGVEVTAGNTVPINVELKVGEVAETVTVAGLSPIVDVQSAAQTRSLSAQVFKELPSSGSWIQMAALVPAIRASVQDVGGVLGDQTGAQVFAHGSRDQDGVSMIDGLRIGNMYQSSNLTNMSLSPLLFEQVDVQLSGQMAETGTNGVIMNAIPKAGGNRFTGTVLINGSGPSWQSGNITQRLMDRGLTGASTSLKKLYDINGAIGGPLKRDKLWFYATSRYFTNEFYLAGRFYPIDVTQVRRADDSSRQAYGGTYTYDNNGRVTWAISDKQKLTGWYAYQYKVDPFWLIQTFIQAPEASRVTTWHTQLSTTKWTYTPTNRLLFEAGVAAGGSPDTIAADLGRVGGIAIQELGGAVAPPLTYRAPTGFDFDDRLPSQSFNVSASYVTGSHNAKVGVELQRGYFRRGDNNESTGGIWYVTRDYQPLQVVIQSPLAGWQNNLNRNLGIFAQDRWTLRRLTLSGGLRLDLQNESTEPFTAAPHTWLPNRHDSLAAVENVPNWKDVDPRVSLAYDVFGDGKTAIKASASRSVRQDSIAIAAANNPASTLQTQTARTWNDNQFGPGDARTGNFTPDCDLLNGASNGECGPWLTPAFGSSVPGTRYDPAILNGWGVRPWNWEFSTSVQHELAPRLSLSVGYFRRVFGNFQITDNEALTSADFTRYSVTLPTSDSRLPDAGIAVDGFYDVNRIIAARNVVKDASNFGNQFQHWNGVDVTVDARLRGGLFLQGGVSTGRTLDDNCEIVAQVPELLAANPPATPATNPATFCRQESPFLAQYKALGSHTLPYGVRVSGTYQSLPGPVVLANNVYVGSAGTLGRSFTAGSATLGLIQPNTAYGDRLNEFDLRFTKIVTVGHGRVDFNVDLFNAFNSDAILVQNNTFGAAWQRPLTVIQPRFVKVAARWDF